MKFLAAKRVLYRLSVLFVPAVLFAFPEGLAAQSDDQLSLLSAKIRSGTVEEKRDALYRIRNLEDQAASEIAVPALTDKSDVVRASAAYAVVFLPPRRAGAVLGPLLNDKSAFVRREGAYALGETGDLESADLLVSSIKKDNDIEVRGAAAVSLGRIGTARQIEALADVLKRKPRKKDEFLRRSAARSIGQIAQFVQTQQRQTSTPTDFLPESYLIIEARRFERLSDAFPAFRIASDVLIRAFQNEKEFADVKRDAAFALGAIGGEASIPALAGCRNAADYYLAEICRKALAGIRAK